VTGSPKRLALLVSFVLMLTVTLANPITATVTCQDCRYSRNQFGFCRLASSNTSGYNWCFEYVADPLSGRTDCDLYDTCAVQAGGDGEC
jgi:hypothetical protein